MVKDYLKNHLNKSFITYNNISYTSLILFAKKPQGGWRFYINYRKLNTLIKKNRYPLLLIEKILICLVKIHIYTKLDIQQIFYKI